MTIPCVDSNTQDRIQSVWPTCGGHRGSGFGSSHGEYPMVGDHEEIGEDMYDDAILDEDMLEHTVGVWVQMGDDLVIQYMDDRTDPLEFFEFLRDNGATIPDLVEEDTEYNEELLVGVELNPGPGVSEEDMEKKHQTDDAAEEKALRDIAASMPLSNASLRNKWRNDLPPKKERRKHAEQHPNINVGAAGNSRAQRGGKKHPKDVAKLQHKVTPKDNKRNKQPQHDGLKGEGPVGKGRKIIKTAWRKTGSPASVAASLADDRARSAGAIDAAKEMVKDAEMIRDDIKSIEDDMLKRIHALGGSTPPPSAPPPVAGAPSSLGPTPEEHKDNLRSRARNLWLTRDPSKEADKKMVLTALTQLARNLKMYESIPNDSKVILDIYYETMYETIELRCGNLMCTDDVRAKPGVMKMFGDIMAPLYKVKRMTTDEAGDPFAPRTYAPKYKKIYWYILPILVALVEEFIKLAVTQVCVQFTMYNTLDQYEELMYYDKPWYCRWFVTDSIYSITTGLHHFPSLFVRNKQFTVAFSDYVDVPFMVFKFEKFQFTVPDLKYDFCAGDIDYLTLFRYYYVSTALATLLLCAVVFPTVEYIWRELPRRKYLNLLIVHCSCSVIAVVWGLQYAVLWHWLYNITCYYSGGEQANICLPYHCDHCCDDNMCIPTTVLQNKFKVKFADPHCKPAFGYRCAWTSKFVQPTVFRGCSHNIKYALYERVGRLIKGSTPSQRARNWKRAGDNFINMFKRGTPLRVRRPMPMTEFLNRYPGRQKRIFEEHLKNETELEMRASAFLKREIGFSIQGVTKSPRVIQGCHPTVTMAAGPSVVVTTKFMKQRMLPNWDCSDFKDGRQIVYTSGYNTSEVGEAWHKAITTLESMLEPGDRLIFIEDDQSKFDVHLVKEAFQYRDKLGKLTLTRRANKALRRTAKTKGRFPDGTKYTLPYSMQSGQPDTALFDTEANATMKSDIHGIGQLWYSLICGDDSLTAMSYKLYLKLCGGDNSKLVDAYTGFGMEVTISTTFSKEDVEFCSSRFMYLDNTAIMVPKPGRLIHKIFCDITMRSDSDHYAWLRSVIVTMNQYAMCDPLYGILAMALHPGTGRTLPSEGIDYSHKPYYVNVPLKCVHSYYLHHYGISVEQYNDLCFYLATQTYGQVADHPLLEILAADVNGC